MGIDCSISPAPPSGERHADAYRVTRAVSPHRKFFSDTLLSTGKLTLTARLPSLLLFHRHRHRDWLQGIAEFVARGGDDLVHHLHASNDFAEDGVGSVQSAAVRMQADEAERLACRRPQTAISNWMRW